MTLDEWLRATGQTADQLATAIGWSSAQISRVRNRKANPSAELVREIFRHTKGAVGQADLIPVVLDDMVAKTALDCNQSDA